MVGMIKKFSFVGLVDKKTSEIWSWSINLLEKIVVPVFADLGYEYLEREVLEPESQFLSFADIKQLAEDDLIVFDLTNNQPEIFYKLAIRHILQKPVLHLIRQGTKNSLIIDGMQVLAINIDNFEEIEASRQKLKEQIYFLEQAVQVSLPYVIYLQQLLTIFAGVDTDKNKDAIFNLLNHFESINTSLNYAKEDLVVLSDQLIYRKQEPPPSPFVERRLAKVELIGMRKKEAKTSDQNNSRDETDL